MRQAYHITKGADRSRRRRRAGFGVLKVGIWHRANHHVFTQAPPYRREKENRECESCN
jgi:hypothetical protein